MKSQVSIEFLISVTILLLIYVATLAIYDIYFKVPILETETGKQACYTVLNGIDAVVVGGDGFATNVSLPDQIAKNDYLVFISNRSIITVDWNKSEFACSITTQSVSNIIFRSCRFSVINLNGTVYLGTLNLNQSEYPAGEAMYFSGSYYFGNVSLSIFYSNGSLLSGYPINLETSDNIFEYSWTPSMTGRFKIVAQDSIYKNLNSDKWVEIV
jgi:hypothetical protein